MKYKQHLVALINRFSQACYWLHESRRARLLLWVTAMLGMASLLFVRPNQVENATVKPYKLSDILITTADTWVRVEGILMPITGYQTQYDLGPMQLRGGRFIPMVHPNSPDPVWVLDEDVPAYRPGMPVTLTGVIRLGTGDQPPLYLQPGLPPNVVLINWLARLGGAGLVVSLMLSAIAWLAHFALYALPSPVAASSNTSNTSKAPSFTWYGDLGKEFGEVMVRELPCEFAATVHEVRFNSGTPKFAWRVCVRRLRAAQLTNLATSYGPLPAARILFEDERGLIRRAVFAANSALNRDRALQVMSLIR